MIYQDVILLLREIAFQAVQEQPEDSFFNLPCGCTCPGKELRCEDCPHLEACLSRSKTRRFPGNNKLSRI
jgi:hypothetical protein